MGRKSIKVQVIGRTGKWITGHGESVQEATQSAMTRAKPESKSGSKKRKTKNQPERRRP